MRDQPTHDREAAGAEQFVLHEVKQMQANGFTFEDTYVTGLLGTITIAPAELHLPLEYQCLIDQLLKGSIMGTARGQVRNNRIIALASTLFREVYNPQDFIGIAGGGPLAAVPMPAMVIMPTPAESGAYARCDFTHFQIMNSNFWLGRMVIRMWRYTPQIDATTDTALR